MIESAIKRIYTHPITELGYNCGYALTPSEVLRAGHIDHTYVLSNIVTSDPRPGCNGIPCPDVRALVVHPSLGKTSLVGLVHSKYMVEQNQDVLSSVMTNVSDHKYLRAGEIDGGRMFWVSFCTKSLLSRHTLIHDHLGKDSGKTRLFLTPVVSVFALPVIVSTTFGDVKSVEESVHHHERIVTRLNSVLSKRQTVIDIGHFIWPGETTQCRTSRSALLSLWERNTFEDSMFMVYVCVCLYSDYYRKVSKASSAPSRRLLDSLTGVGSRIKLQALRYLLEYVL